MRTSICVGIAGGSGSGKSTLAEAVAAHFGGDALFIEHDRYYRDQQQLTFEERLQTNYDHPDALETGLLVRHLEALFAGTGVEMPSYDFTQHTRSAETTFAEPKPVIVIEGLHVLGDEKLRARLSLKVYVEAAGDVRFIRRMQRDVAERGRDIDGIVQQYIDQVRPMHREYIEPTKAFADLIVDGEGDLDQEVRKVLSVIPYRQQTQ